MRSATPIRGRRHRRAMRRGFNLVELLIALAISAALLTSTMVALDASFMAYQSTAELSTTHTIGRMTMNRMLALIRTGTEFGPFPVNPKDSIVESDFIQFRTRNGQVMELNWDEDDEALYIVLDPNTPDEVWHMLLDGVVPQLDAGGTRIRPFTLEYELGRRLFRATIDMNIVPDATMAVDLDGDGGGSIRMVASAMPRTIEF